MNNLNIISPPVKTVVAGLCKCSSNCCNLHNPTPAARSPLLQYCPAHHKKGPSCPPKIHTKTIQSPKKKTRNNLTTTTTTSTATVSDVLRLMDSLQFPIPTEVYASLLKECTDLKDAVGGAEVHAHIINRTITTTTTTTTTTARSSRRRPPPGPALANRLLLMYASCGCLDAARNLFDKMTTKDFISWLTMIAAHVDHNDPEEALQLFKKMQQRPLVVQKVKSEHHYYYYFTPSVLKACIHSNDFGLGKQVHGCVLKLGHGEDLLLCSLFIGFYAKFRCLESARRVFDKVMCRRCRRGGHRDTVIWTTMMVAYCREGHFEEVIHLFKEMGSADGKKNNFTFSTVLRACGRRRRIRDEDDDDNDDNGRSGRQVHANAIKLGVVESDLFVQSSLVDMYGRCGLLKDARMVFEMICGSKRNDVCWSAMLNSYTRHGHYNEAIKLLYLMKAAGIQPQESMLNTLRIACGGGGK